MQIKDYSGSVYGGLGHLLHHYCQAKNLVISEKLQQVQTLERFDFSLWRELLNEIQLQRNTAALGLEIAEYVQAKHLGIIAYIAQACETLGEALIRYHDFHRLIYDGSPLKIETDDHYVAIRWELLPSHLTTQITDEIAIALMLQFLKHVLNLDHIPIHQVQFTQAAPANIKIYQQYFKSSIRFSQTITALILPRSFLNTSLKHADQTLQKLLMQQAKSLCKKLPYSTQLDERLQQSILKGLQNNHYQIKSIAEQLNLSVRQLQRHLQQQNTTYQQRLQEIRQRLAIQYLNDPHLSLQEVALLLSYSEQSAFHRAFKQWTGLTPQQWRLQHQIF